MLNDFIFLVLFIVCIFAALVHEVHEEVIDSQPKFVPRKSIFNKIIVMIHHTLMVQCGAVSPL